MVWRNLTMLLCILWSSNCCESNTQIGRNPVFLNSLFCTCIPILFMSISYPLHCWNPPIQTSPYRITSLIDSCQRKPCVVCPAPATLCSTPAQRLQRWKCSPQQGSNLQTVFRRLRSSSPSLESTTTALPSSTEQMTLRTTRVYKRGRTLLCMLMLCILNTMTCYFIVVFTY